MCVDSVNSTMMFYSKSHFLGTEWATVRLKLRYNIKDLHSKIKKHLKMNFLKILSIFIVAVQDIFLIEAMIVLCLYWRTARTCKTWPTTGNSLSHVVSFLVLDDVRVIFGSFSILKISLMIRLFLRSLKCEYADAEKRSIMNMYSKRGAMNMLYPQAKLEFLIFSSVAARSQRPSVET